MSQRRAVEALVMERLPITLNDPALGLAGNMTTSVPAGEPFDASVLGDWVSSRSYNVDERVIAPATRIIHTSLKNNNTAALTDATAWYSGTHPEYENRLKAFDDKASSATRWQGDIVITVTPGRPVNTLALFGVLASRVRVVMSDPDAGVVFESEHTLLKPSGNSYYNWLFGRMERETRLQLGGLPPYWRATLTVTLSVSGSGFTELGTLACGWAQSLGNAEWGATGEVDYWGDLSRDQWGNFEGLLGAGERSDLLNVRLVVRDGLHDAVLAEAKKHYGRVTVWSFAGDYLRSLMVLGVLRSAKVTFSAHGLTYLQLRIDGVT